MGEKPKKNECKTRVFDLSPGHALRPRAWPLRCVYIDLIPLAQAARRMDRQIFSVSERHGQSGVNKIVLRQTFPV